MGLNLLKKDKAVLNLAVNKKTLHQNLEFTATEQYKLLRANLDFTLPVDEKCPVIGVTSSMRGEGKSTTAINLAYVLAEKKNKVLLIDGDLRLPSIAKKMEIDENAGGSTNLLIGKGANLNEFKSNILPNWYILPVGETPPNPSELISSPRMATILKDLREYFDYIIIDLPPVNLVSDAVAVSSMITGMILVIREEYATKREVENCVRQLKLSNVNVLGCVMNAAKSESRSYSKKYYKSYYKDNSND